MDLGVGPDFEDSSVGVSVSCGDVDSKGFSLDRLCAMAVQALVISLYACDFG